MTNQTKTTSKDHAERFAESGHRAVDQMADRLKSTEDRLSETTDEIKTRGEQSAKQARHYIEEHPLTSLGIAFAGGVILSALLRK